MISLEPDDTLATGTGEWFGMLANRVRFANLQRRPTFGRRGGEAENRVAPRVRQRPLRHRVRILSATLLTGVLTALAIAAALEPAAAGWGTHQRFGLQPCAVRVWFNIPCPACGMTTSWSLLVRLRPGEALMVNAGGVMLAGLAMAIGAIAVNTVLSGRRPRRWVVWCSVVWAWAAVVVALGQWGWRVG